MILDSNKILDVVEVPPFTDSAYFELEVEENSSLILESNSHIILRKGNKLILKNNSRLYLGNNSQLSVKSGAFLYNYGASVRGNGRIVFEYIDIINQLADFLIEDSVKLILNDSAVVSIPHNTTLHIRGNTTSLILKPGSKLMFGENSGIVCNSGGKVIASNATFASSDSTKKWNGISLSDLSQDTIKNCVIKNAMYGISISDKYDSEETPFPYSAEISGCSFINQTNYVLNSAVYIAGSNNVLVMNNSVSSTVLEKGFTHGIYAEYCPEGVFNIIGNDISGAGNGITLIGCSPFAAQNILTGNEYSECGMFLDNSNGTFEYNEVNGFYCSYFSYYSSPDLLKNVFENYHDDNMWLSSSSVPVMHPLINGSSVYWYAGDNLIKGSPSNSGILFDDDACPLLNYGYNRFIMTNIDYYIQGSNPSGYGREFYVIQNYWGGIPDTNKFDVSNAEVVYSPYDDNSQTARQTNSEEKFDIGFGLYDTVFSYEPDNPNSAQDLFIEAYRMEYAGEFTEAIEIYKEIVEDYKDSTYASSCLSRIFGCHEKNNTTQSGYGQLESYYESISEDTSYNEIQRNIAEEFRIKSKVKQNQTEEAIADYNEIYTQNINTAKGMHAFINREILSQSQEGDNISAGSVFENIEAEQNAINSLISKIIKKEKNIFTKTVMKPEGFRLNQNYPNPFNPVTKINYTISFPLNKGGQGVVTLKVYNVLGNEVATLVNEKKSAGSYSVEFDGTNLASGVYYYRLEAGEYTAVRKMLLIK